MRPALLALLLTACTNVHVNRAALVASTAALACDWGQTRSAATQGWRYHYENNPIMGPKPPVGYVDLYFGGIAITNALLWLVIPRRYRVFVPLAIFGIETRQAARNVDLNSNHYADGSMRTISMCGL